MRSKFKNAPAFLLRAAKKNSRALHKSDSCIKIILDATNFLATGCQKTDLHCAIIRALEKSKIFNMEGGDIMIKTTIKITGMACTMCEAHINEAVRNAFSVKKVKSSHSKGETVILSEEPLDEAALRKTIEATGYTTGEMTSDSYKKNGLFSFLKK